MIALEIPPFIAAAQVRAQFVDLTEDALERALRHYGPTQAKPEAAGVPVQPKSILAPQVAPEPPLPAYLVRAARDRQAWAAKPALAPKLDPQRSLF